MDLHITVRLWHLAAFLVGLVALWHLQGAPCPQKSRHGGRRQHLREQAMRLLPNELPGQPVPAFAGDAAGSPPVVEAKLMSAVPVTIATTPSPPPPPPPIVQLSAAGSRSAVAGASTESLISELHGRRYDWEIIERAGLRFSQVQRVELLHYLKRDAAQFGELLSNTSLGLSTLSTAQLLRGLSRRGDLAAALRATGLGAGTDFQCDFDESPRDGGCQIRCADGKNCRRAEQKCHELGHCVQVDQNRDGTWATLKSLQVFMPVAPPTCEGYAFEANGSVYPQSTARTNRFAGPPPCRGPVAPGSAPCGAGGRSK